MYRFNLDAATIIFALTLAVSAIGLLFVKSLIVRCLFRPYWFVRNAEYSTLITSGLVHADLPHLIFNLITYYFFSFQLERRIGSGRFLALYLSGLVLSNLGTYVKHRNNPAYSSLGASGAILAVLFAFIVYFPHSSMFIMPIPIPIPAPLFALGYLAYSYYSSRQNVGRINHDAHIGGALTGMVFVAVTDPTAFRALSQIKLF